MFQGGRTLIWQLNNISRAGADYYQAKQWKTLMVECQ